MKKLVPLTLAATAFAMGASAPTMAAGELSASAAVSSMYLWRGQDLGNGSPAVSGDISYSIGGFHGGMWTSSGDSSAGNEYDLWVGWGGEWDAFSVDLSVWTYEYPADDGSYDDLGNLSEVILTVGVGPVSVSYYDNIAGSSGYTYITAGVDFLDKFSATLGLSQPDQSDSDYLHLDLGYAYNDRLSFTASQVIDDDDGAGVDTSLKFVVSYSLPLM